MIFGLEKSDPAPKLASEVAVLLVSFLKLSKRATIVYMLSSGIRMLKAEKELGRKEEGVGFARS